MQTYVDAQGCVCTYVCIYIYTLCSPRSAPTQCYLSKHVWFIESFPSHMLDVLYFLSICSVDNAVYIIGILQSELTILTLTSSTLFLTLNYILEIARGMSCQKLVINFHVNVQWHKLQHNFQSRKFHHCHIYSFRTIFLFCFSSKIEQLACETQIITTYRGF